MGKTYFGKEFIGKKFGELLVLRETSERRGNKTVYECQCDCGNICYKTSTYLRRGKKPTCGHNLREVLTGKKIGSLTVLSETEKRTKYRDIIYLCQCDCGGLCEKSSSELKYKYNNPHYPHCGCLHRISYTPEFTLWFDIKQRCYNPNNQDYGRYGGRGIQMYEPWINDFTGFYIWIRDNLGLRPSPKHSMDRINNDGNYEPGNLRWALQYQQVHNSSGKVFTEEDIVNVRKRFSERTTTVREFVEKIIEEYNCSKTTVYDIIYNMTWTQLDIN